MANDLTKNPILLDTFTSAVTVTWMGSGKLNIREIVWLAPTDAAHTLVLTINGQAVTFTAGAAVDKSILAQPLGWVDSFVVTSAGSGKVAIFLD